jgi:flavodoxin
MAEVGIFVGTMYGNSLLVAEEAEAILANQGHKATVYEDPELADWEKYKDKYILVVTSTTGQGDLPDSIVPLFQGLKTSSVISRTFTTALSPSVTAPMPIFVAAVSSLTRFCRNRVPSALATCC